MPEPSHVDCGSGDEAVPGPLGDRQAVRHVIGGIVVPGHGGRGRPREVVVEDPSQRFVAIEVRVDQGLIEASDRPAVHVIVRPVAAVNPHHGCLVPVGLRISGGTPERLRPIGGQPLGVVGLVSVAERVADHVVGQDPGVPGGGQAKQAVGTAGGVVDRLHRPRMPRAGAPDGARVCDHGSMERRANREYLRTVAYADDRFLRDRLSLYDHQQPRLDPVGETIRALGDLAGRLVADVGCGNGAYHAALDRAGASVIAVDLSDGMLRSLAAQPLGRVAADAQALPLAAASVDVALAMHMLYHVPDPPWAVAELARVIRPDGQLVAAVGGGRHLAEAHELWMPLLAEAGLDVTLREFGLVNDRLAPDRLEEILGDHFERVTSRTLTSQVMLQEPGPLLRHAASTSAAKVTDEQGAGMIARLDAAAAAKIRRDGVLRITTEIAWFRATGPTSGAR